MERPNHGLTHGARQAYLLLDLLTHLADNSGQYGSLGDWAQSIRNDFNKKDILFLMALHFRAARKEETENYFSEYVSHIKKVLRHSQRGLSDQEINDYADLLSEKPNLSNEDKKFIMMALDISHRADHLRQRFWDLQEWEKNMQTTIGFNGHQNEDNQQILIAFMQERAALYLKATGAYNKKEEEMALNKEEWIKTKEQLGEYWFSDAKLFGELERSPDKLYEILESITLDKM